MNNRTESAQIMEVLTTSMGVMDTKVGDALWLIFALTDRLNEMRSTPFELMDVTADELNSLEFAHDQVVLTIEALQHRMNQLRDGLTLFQSIVRNNVDIIKE